MLNQLRRILAELDKVDVCSERYDKLLMQYHTVYKIRKETADLSVEQADAPSPEEATSETAELPVSDKPVKAARTAKKATVKKDSDCTPPWGDTPHNEKELSEPQYTSEQVRSMLADLAKNGTPIQPIVGKYTPEGKPVKFSSIPADQYPALVKELETHAG